MDGFIVRKNERHRMVQRMRTSSEWGLSDHRAKVLRVKVDKRKWRVDGRNADRAPHGVLTNEEKKEEYMDLTRVKWNERENERRENGDA